MGFGHRVDLVARLCGGESVGDWARLLRVGMKLKHARQDAQGMVVTPKCAVALVLDIQLRDEVLGWIRRRQVQDEDQEQDQGNGRDHADDHLRAPWWAVLARGNLVVPENGTTPLDKSAA